MATKENINWKRINMGDILPCQSFLRKKNGEILKLSTVGGVKVGQDCYYLPVDEVINIIKDYPVEESEDEKIRCTLINHFKTQVDLSRTWNGLKIPDIIAWLEKQGKHKPIQEYDDMAYEMARAVLYDQLKDSLRSQSTWKPSEEEIKALTHLFDGHLVGAKLIPKDYDNLRLLLEQLKKLREE